MSTYDAFRHFADSWGLVFMLAFFVGVFLFVLRPGAKQEAKDAASIPFKDER